MNDKLKVRLTGKNTDYFFKELIRRKINIYNISKSENKLEIIINKKDLKEIKSIKTSLKLKIVDYYGLSKIKFILNKYKLLILFSLLSIILNIVLSNIIFKVEVVNSNKLLLKEIKEELESLGIKKYSLRPSKNKIKEIKEKLLENSNIEWIEIERHGTKYTIKVEERKINSSDEKCLPRNIVSKKNAIISKINVAKGEIVKKKDDYVTKGETIVSGFIHNKDTIKNKVCSTGTIYGYTWYKINVKMPISKTIYKEMSKNKYGIYIELFNKKANLNNTYKHSKKKYFKLIKSDFLPINICFVKYTKVSKYSTKLSTKAQNKKALKLAENKIKEKLSDDANIINKKILKKAINDSKIDIDIFIEVEENITDYFDISDVSIDELNGSESD